MTPLQHVLAITDFSVDADHAVARAARIAADHSAALQLLHVVSESSLAGLRELAGPTAIDAQHVLLAAAESELERSASELHGALSITATSSVRIGSVIEETVDAARQADLIVMGARGTNPIRDVVLGTTAERLLHRSVCPALVVRRAPLGPYGRVVAAVDCSPGSELLLRAAVRITPDAEVHVLHAFDVPYEGRLRLVGVPDADIQGYRRQQGTRALAAIQRLIESAAPAQRFVPVVANGNAIEALLTHEQENRSDLIIIGKHATRALVDFVLGSVTRHVLADAGCDVLVVACDVSTDNS